MTCISWFKDFTLCLEDYLMNKCPNLYIGACDAKVYLIIFKSVSDLYFMVQ